MVGFREFHDRLQTFVIFFIDAASFIDVDDPKWRFYTVYAVYIIVVLFFNLCTLLLICHSPVCVGSWPCGVGGWPCGVGGRSCGVSG